MLIAVPMFLVACDNGNGDGGGGTGNGGGGGGNTTTPDIETVDYASQVTLDLTSIKTKKQEVTVRQHIDGDTTHFNFVKNSQLTGYVEADFADLPGGYIKARYIAINTPESTGKIEKWGKAASNFTKAKLESAETIIVESDNDTWNKDSTGGRLTLWVWYRTSAEAEFRNLNIEILQNGYAVASNTGDSRYGEIGVKAIEQAAALKLNVHAPANVKDPLFYEDGDENLTHLSLRELRCHISEYEQKPVRVEGTVTATFSNTAYIEDFDEETGLYYGVAVYYGYAKDGIREALKMGNRVNVYGKVTLFSGSWQISGVSKNEISPKKTDTQVLGDGGEGAFTEIDVADIYNGRKVSIELLTDEGTQNIELDYPDAIMSTSVIVKNLTVMSIYVTDNDGDNDGAMSITCETADGDKIVVRTSVLIEDGKLVTPDRYEGQTITVKGIFSYYEPPSGKGQYQIAVPVAEFITVL